MEHENIFNDPLCESLLNFLDYAAAPLEDPWSSFEFESSGNSSPIMLFSPDVLPAPSSLPLCDVSFCYNPQAQTGFAFWDKTTKKIVAFNNGFASLLPWAAVQMRSGVGMCVLELAAIFQLSLMYVYFSSFFFFLYLKVSL